MLHSMAPTLPWVLVPKGYIATHVRVVYTTSAAVPKLQQQSLINLFDPYRRPGIDAHQYGCRTRWLSSQDRVDEPRIQPVCIQYRVLPGEVRITVPCLAHAIWSLFRGRHVGEIRTRIGMPVVGMSLEICPSRIVTASGQSVWKPLDRCIRDHRGGCNQHETMGLQFRL